MKAGADGCAAAVPFEDLLGGVAVVALVEFAQQGRAGEAAFAQVVDEIDEGVELVLGERNFDVAGDGLLGCGDVVGQELLGAGAVDAAGEGLAGADAVAVADGEQPGGIAVYDGTKTFELTQEGEACRTEPHAGISLGAFRAGAPVRRGRGYLFKAIPGLGPATVKGGRAENACVFQE